MRAGRPLELRLAHMPVSREAVDENIVDRAVRDSQRLAMVESIGLLDTATEEPYDRISRIASRMMSAPIATVTLIDRDRQFYKACVGIPEPLSTTRETSLDYSFCKHTIALGTPLVIADTLLDARVAEIPSVTQFNVRAYAGVPLLISGQAVGTLCVMDLRPRSWTDLEVDTLIDLAATVMTEIKLRMTVGELEVMSEVAGAARAEAEQANRAKGEFLAMISHDLRTPLNAIGGYCDLLELGIHGPVTDAQKDMLTRIKSAEKHLESLITEVLTFSQLEAGTETITLTEVSVESVLREVQSLVRPQLDVKGLEFIYRNSDPSALVLADEGKLKRIVLNLMTNAIKFTPRPGQVSLAWREEGSRIVIAVQDTGVGIAADRIGTIFDPFVQIPGQKAMNPDGVGLGLSIGSRLARAMGGSLTATSAPGEGTLFELALPRRAAPDAGGGM
ncbi:MAG: GAF domain-containing sensor histidine kinase [Polaromonas sp.]|nr:GAF domain-containing sensor histidine kinase [Gemmatimonadaceae bacterium]